MDAALVRPHAVPERGGNGLAILLAVIMHALLAALLFFGIRWQSSPPDTVQAELWNATPQTAAPRALPPPPKVVAPTPQPVVREAPEPPAPKADIVEKAPEKVVPKKPVPKVEPPPVKAAPQPPAPKAEPPKTKPVKEAPRAPSQSMEALMAAAESPNGTGPVTSTGRDKQTSGPQGQDSYIARLRAAIQTQMRYPGGGNPVATFRIEQLPTGEVIGVTLLKSSGTPAFDTAVERAIQAASPLPKKPDGSVARSFDLNYFLNNPN